MNRRAQVLLAVSMFFAVVLPIASRLAGNDVFAWTMFSKSETYRMTVVGTALDGERVPLDPRMLSRYANPTLAYFLPAPGVWRHDPVGLTFRTGLGNVANMACRLGQLASTEVSLEEKRDLDATAKVTVARAQCH
jgi:hypothetical protein